jgi:hypothetical protein
MALYKKISPIEISCAEHEINCPDGRVITVADHIDATGEIYDDWYWFNSREEAKIALGVTDPEIIKPE